MKSFCAIEFDSRCAQEMFKRSVKNSKLKIKFRSIAILYRIKTIKCIMSNSGMKPQNFKLRGQSLNARGYCSL